MRGKLLILLLLLALFAPQAMGEGAMLGVQIRYTPEPSAAPSPDVQEATAGEALMRTITQEEMDAAGLGERILMRGMEGADVVLVQRRLQQLGYYLGEIDGVYGLQTRSAVYAFQRAHGLSKIDGKVGPQTIERLFGEDVIVKPTPTPSPTPKPTKTPVPTPSPSPTPVPTAVPDAAGAPFALETMELYVNDVQTSLLVGRDEKGERLYPLCGVMQGMGYRFEHAAGSWQLTREKDDSVIALMTAGETGLCAGAMGSADGVIFLTDERIRVYAYSGEAYVTAPLLEQLGLTVLLVGETPVIH